MIIIGLVIILLLIVALGAMNEIYAVLIRIEKELIKARSGASDHE